MTAAGELDISNVERFEQELMELEQPRPPLVVLDLGPCGSSTRPACRCS